MPLMLREGPTVHYSMQHDSPDLDHTVFTVVLALGGSSGKCAVMASTCGRYKPEDQSTLDSPTFTAVCSFLLRHVPRIHIQDEYMTELMVPSSFDLRGSEFNLTWKARCPQASCPTCPSLVERSFHVSTRPEVERN